MRVDFADVETVMRGSGRAHMSVVKAAGKNRALEVAEGALSSSLLDDNRITGAKEILLSFAVSDIDLLTQDDITIAMEYIQKNASYVDDDGTEHAANIIWGASEKSTLDEEELELVVVATRFVDGTKLNINPVYVKEEDTPFVEPQREDMIPPKEPEIAKKTKTIPAPKPPVTISPLQQDRYKQVKMQIASPAYVRRGVTFENESETQVRTTTFQPSTRERVAEVEAPSTGGSLFD